MKTESEVTATRCWMVRTHSVPDDYAQKGLVGLGWSGVNICPKCTGNPNGYEQEEDVFSELANLYRIKNVSGKSKGEIRRFRSIAKGDIIVVPCYKGFYLGKSTGSFTYDERNSDDHKNQLNVEFHKTDGNPTRFERKGKNTALQAKLGTRFTVLEIRDSEIIKELTCLYNGEKTRANKLITLENNALIDFKASLVNVLQNYNQTNIDGQGRGFENLLCKVLEMDGFKTKILSKKIGKGKADADILAIKESLLGDEFKTVCYIQAKHHVGETGTKGIEQIKLFKKQIEEMSNDNDPDLAPFDNIVCLKDINDEKIYVRKDDIRYFLVTTADFSDDCLELSDDGIRLINGERLAEIIFDKIDKLDDLRFELGYYKKYCRE